MLTEWWLRPVSSACRVGEHSAVVWKRLYLSPLPASFSKFVVWHGPPNALDEAINALELRAQSGQMILIVSHVPAIAQRIERILQVRPDPEGSSAEWLDDEDRESLLDGAVSTEV